MLMGARVCYRFARLKIIRGVKNKWCFRTTTKKVPNRNLEKCWNNKSENVEQKNKMVQFREIVYWKK